MPEERVVDFAVPFDVRCGLCDKPFLCGSSVTATKNVGTVSECGLVTWRFLVSCPCMGELEFITDAFESRRFVPAGQAVALQELQSRPKRRPRTMHAQSCDTAIASGERDRFAQEANALKDLEARQYWAHADVASTTDVLLSRLEARWDATPCRRVARDRGGGKVKRTLEAKRIARRVKRSAQGPVLANQRALVGRMSRSQFSTTRRAVRSLHRGSAFRRIVTSSCRGMDYSRGKVDNS